MTFSVFSSYERQVLDILGSKEMTTAEIAEKFSWGSITRPTYPANSISGYIRQINRKCEYHKFKWFINGMGSGRGGRTVWKDRHK